MREKKIFKGKLLQLSQRKQRLPNNYLVTLEVITHPGAVLIVPILSKDKLILIKQYRPVIDSYIWEFPAGTLAKNERPLTCAKRELIEEIGYTGAHWKRVGSIYPAPGYTNEKIIIYSASGLKKKTANVQSDEIIESEICTKLKIKKLVRAGEIVDAKTLSALTLCGFKT